MPKDLFLLLLPIAIPANEFFYLIHKRRKSLKIQQINLLPLKIANKKDEKILCIKLIK